MARLKSQSRFLPANTRTALPRRLTLCLLAGLLPLLLSAVQEEAPDELDPAGTPSVQEPARAIAADEDLRPLPDPGAFFSQLEMADWRHYRLTRVKLSLIAIGSVLCFYTVFLLLGLNRRLKALSDKAVSCCYASPHLARAGSRLPALRRMVAVPEQLFGGRQWLGVLIYCLLFFSLLEFCLFPYSLYRSFWFEVRQGLSNYTLALWLADWLKGLCLTTVLDAAMVFGIYGLLARVGSRWWLLVWAGVSVAIFAWVVILPYRSLLFSRFHPLEAGEVRTRLEALAREQGLQVEDILVVDASRRTRAVNAYVQGTGPTRRMVLFDNLLQQFSPREIVMVFAHELAHWKHPPGKMQYLVFSFTVFLVLGTANRVLERGSRVGWLHYGNPRDVASLPVLLLTFYLMFLLIKPASLCWKRSHEMEADRQALEMVCDPDAYIQVHVKLARLNRQHVDPPPWFVTFFSSHPPFRDRLRLAWSQACPPPPP